MDFTAAITMTLSRQADGIGPVDGDATQRRLVHADYWRAAFNYTWFHRDWWFRKASPTATVPAGVGYVVVPASFSSFGYKGGLYLSTTAHRLRYVDPQVITDLRAGPSPLTTDLPTVYSIFGQDSTTNRPYIQLPKNTSALTLTLWSDKTPPTLDESTNANNLKSIPEQWHEIVLLPGARAMAQERKADARYRAMTQDPEFREGLAMMAREEMHGRETERQLPRFDADSDFYFGDWL